MKTAATILRGLLLVVAAATAARGSELDYRDWSEGGIVMIFQSILYEEARVYSLGPIAGSDLTQLAMLISEDADVEDGGSKNAVLIECGMHGREWFASESCYWLIDHLLQNRNRAWMRELLAHTDIWIIPQSNPAGRDVDDPGWGDPTEFLYVCDDGANAGNNCSDDGDCPGGACYRKGWRTNSNRDSCELGVDLARNFSSGWDSAVSLCTPTVCDGGTKDGDACTSDADCLGGGSCDNARMFYRGPAPFSESETLNLRRFVHNHMISMAAIVRANAQQIWNRWHDSNSAAAYMTDTLVELNELASALYPNRGDPDPTMLPESVGGGYGQFSAWLTSAANVSGELDSGTERNISTFYFELPVKDSRYQAPFRNRSDDRSNSFHPSDTQMRSLSQRVVRPLLTYVIRQARSPQCPIDGAGDRVVSECETDDFGLVGAKIGDATDQPGRLEYDPATREETLPFGNRLVVFAVQNFSSSAASTSTHATLTIRKDGSVEATHVEPISLLPGERVVASVSHFFSPGATYRVELALDADDFSRNDRKSFAFRVPSLLPAGRAVQLGTARLRVRRGDPPTQGRLSYRGKFLLEDVVHPETGGLALAVQGHPPRGPNQIQDPPPLGYQLPSGSPWWDGSRPEQGRWIYRDPDGSAGPIQVLKIAQHASPKRVERVTRVALRTRDHVLAPLSGARAYGIDLDLPADALRLSSLARGEEPMLPEHILAPEDETENEPAD